MGTATGAAKARQRMIDKARIAGPGMALSPLPSPVIIDQVIDNSANVQQKHADGVNYAAESVGDCVRLITSIAREATASLSVRLSAAKSVVDLVSQAVRDQREQERIRPRSRDIAGALAARLQIEQASDAEVIPQRSEPESGAP